MSDNLKLIELVRESKFYGYKLIRCPGIYNASKNIIKCNMVYVIEPNYVSLVYDPDGLNSSSIYEAYLCICGSRIAISAKRILMAAEDRTND